MTTNRSTIAAAAGLFTVAVVAFGFGSPASAGSEPIEPIVPEVPELLDTIPTLPLPDDGPLVTIDPCLVVDCGDDPIITLPPDFGPLPEGDPDPDPTEPTDPTDPVDPTDPTDPVDPTDPTDPVDPTDPTDPTPGVPGGQLPQTGASTVVVAGAALAATTAGAFLCLAAGRRSRTHRTA